jgi:hypothetical protein
MKIRTSPPRMVMELGISGYLDIGLGGLIILTDVVMTE